MSELSMVEYLWLDGAMPTRGLRSKMRLVQLGENPTLEDFPQWSYDGSSTNQADGSNSDCIIKPVCFVKDPIRGEGNYIVMTEVYNADGETAHESNSRAQLRAIMDAGASSQDPWLGFEQEYTLFKDGVPLGWPEQGFPGPQGPYYCAVGAENIFGRDIAEEHAVLCMEAGLMYYGLNAEVMPGQWEFQIGYRGAENDTAGAMIISDHTWIARWLLERVAEEYGVSVSFENKPIKGDWNGAGMHTNVSTNDTRDKSKGRKAIDAAVTALGAKHAEHIRIYGHNNSERLTGDHETCDIDTFKVGAADRGCSIRIPRPVEIKGYGYFEDRRPGANADPYLVAARICATICNIDESVMTFTQWPRQNKAFSAANAA